MVKSQINSATLVVTTLAGALGLLLLPGSLAWFASIGGLILLLILLSYDREGYRSIFQSIAYSAVCGFCCAIALGAVFQLFAAQGEVHLANLGWSTKWLPLTCLFATIIFIAVDRIRMSAREPVAMRRARSAAAPPPGFIPRLDYAPASAGNSGQTTRPAPQAPPVQPAVSTPVQQPFQPAASTPVQQPAQPTFARPAFSSPAPPVEPAPVYNPPPTAPPPVASEPLAPRSLAPEPIVPRVAPEPPPFTFGAEAPRPAPAPIIPHTGKEALIYVNLIGEGLNVLRSVQAEHMGQDYYRIIEPMPEGETWEYQPGQVVRVKKKNLSSGKALVAIEEAPRAK